MAEISPLSGSVAVQDAAQKQSVSVEPKQPWGRPVTSVQPHPTPLIATQPAAVPMVDDSDKRLHQAQLRADITGSGTIGNLVDVIV
jgi:hypothetical protein